MARHDGRGNQASDARAHDYSILAAAAALGAALGHRIGGYRPLGREGPLSRCSPRRSRGLELSWFAVRRRQKPELTTRALVFTVRRAAMPSLCWPGPRHW